MRLLNERKKAGLLLSVTLFFLVFISQQGISLAATKTVGIEPTLHSKGIITLTPGSSTTVEVKPREDWALTTVLCLGAGTLEVKMKKDDTHNDLVSMFIIGFPADPPFIPNFGITPAEISVSTDITDILGGFGIVLIISVANSSESYAHTLSLALD